MTRSARRRALGTLALSSLAMGIFWAPAFEHAQATGYGDWQWFHHMWEAGRTAIVRWGEAPLFDPHHCGGVPLWGNPQAQVYSPTWVVTGLLFGTTLGHKLYLLGHAIVGHAGMYLLGRRFLGLSQVGAFLAATIWACSGFFAWHGAGGHATFISFYWAPWLFLFWRASEHDLRAAVGVGAVMALVVAEGGHYPFPYFVLWLGIDLVLRLVQAPRSAGPILRGALVSGVLGGLLAAYRIVPIYLTVSAHPHFVPDVDSLTPSEIITMLTARDMPAGWAHRWVWNEYGGFLGWTVLGLSAVGALYCLISLARPRAAPDEPIGREPFFLLLGAVLFFLFTQGAASEHHPWPWLQELPFYRSIHVPSRFRVMLSFYLAGLAGVAFDVITTSLRDVRLPHALTGLRGAVPWALALVAVVDLYAVNLGINDRWDGPAIGISEVSPHFHMVRDRWRYLAEYADYPHRHVGTRECYDPIHWEIAPALATGDTAPVARLVPPTAGTVTLADRTSRTMWADVETTEAARLVFEQTNLPGFTSDAGPITDERELVAIELPAGTHRRVTVSYFPTDLPYTLGTSVLGLVACACVWGRARRRATGSITTRASA